MSQIKLALSLDNSTQAGVHNLERATPTLDLCYGLLLDTF